MDAAGGIMTTIDYKLSVLLISGHDSSRDRTIENLGPYFNLTETCTGAEGIERSLARPDIILVNVDLPDMRGFEVCRSIKKNPLTGKIPVLCLTCLAIDAALRAVGVENGADGFLPLPVSPAALMAALSHG